MKTQVRRKPNPGQARLGYDFGIARCPSGVRTLGRLKYCSAALSQGWAGPSQALLLASLSLTWDMQLALTPANPKSNTGAGPSQNKSGLTWARPGPDLQNAWQAARRTREGQAQTPAQVKADFG